MRAVILLAAAALAAAALVAACSPAASSPAEGSSTVGPTTAGSDLAAASAAAHGGTSPSGATASPGGATPAPASPLATSPHALGGPAPVGSLVLGDSIALSAAPQLTRLGYPVVGIVGRSATDSYLREHLTTPLAQQAPAWVIVLGTNNRGDDADVARLAGLVGLIDSLRTPGARQRVFWVTPHRDPRYAGGLAGWSLDAFGAELHRLAGEHRWLRVIDFAATARQHPEWYDADAGRLHPDVRGQDVLAALIAGPDAAPAAIPAPLFSGSPSPEPEPETFVNSPPPTPKPRRTPTPVPDPALTPGAEPMPSSTPVPLEPVPGEPVPGDPVPADQAPAPDPATTAG